MSNLILFQTFLIACLAAVSAFIVLGLFIKLYDFAGILMLPSALWFTALSVFSYYLWTLNKKADWGENAWKKWINNCGGVKATLASSMHFNNMICMWWNQHMKNMQHGFKLDIIPNARGAVSTLQWRYSQIVQGKRRRNEASFQKMFTFVNSIPW